MIIEKQQDKKNEEDDLKEAKEKINKILTIISSNFFIILLCLSTILFVITWGLVGATYERDTLQYYSNYIKDNCVCQNDMTGYGEVTDINNMYEHLQKRGLAIDGNISEVKQ